MDRSGGGEVVVVGAGILGCLVAVHLVERGLRPVLIDPDRPGQGTSTGSFASISAFGKEPAAWFQLACAGMSGWPQFANRLGTDVGLRRAGEVRWTSDSEEGRRLTRQVADARGRGYPIRLIDRAELARLLPDARVGPVTAACFAPNDGQVEPPLVLAACRALLERAGVRFLGGRARVRLDDDGVRVEVGEESLRPRTTVLAAGAEAVQVAAAVGLEVPTLSSPGMLVQTRPLPPFTDRVVYVPGGPGPAVHLRQRADGSVLVGERTQETTVTDPGRHHAQVLLAQAARFFPALAGVGVERWWLAMPADRLPIVGPLPWIDGLYLVVSHSGITLAPCSAGWSRPRSPSRRPTASWPPSAHPASRSGRPESCLRWSRCSVSRPARTVRPDRTGPGPGSQGRRQAVGCTLLGSPPDTLRSPGRVGCQGRWSRAGRAAWLWVLPRRPCQTRRNRCIEAGVRVRDIMWSPVVTVPPGMPLKEVADLLLTRGISAVPVVDGAELVGILSEADLVPFELAADPRAHLAPQPDPPADGPGVVGEAMTRDVVALPEEADVAEAGRLMLERRIKSIPVVRGRRDVGIVARRDLLKALARSDHDIARELEALLSEQLGDPSPYRVVVRQGVAELTGPPDPITRKLARLLTRGIPGAVGVRFRPEGSGEPHNSPAGSRSGSSPSDAARGAPVDDEP